MIVNVSPVPLHEPSEIEIPCVWFFIPMPHPIGLPSGWMAGKGLDMRARIRTTEPSSDLFSSLIVHQLEPSTDPLLTGIADLAFYAAATMADEPPSTLGAEAFERFKAEAAGELDAFKTARTIFEVALPRHPFKSEEEILAGLDVAIEQARVVQRAVALATQRPITLVARQTLPPLVPAYFGVLFSRAEGSTRKPEVRGALTYQIPNCAPPTALGLRPSTFDDGLLERLERSSNLIENEGGYETYADLRREAMTQRQYAGNARMTVIALAAAGEILLDTTLLHMLWEEHTAPADAAAKFNRAIGHTLRVAREFKPRLGGGWDPEARDPSGDYLRVLVRLRHRVIHAGHRPTETEVQAAWDSLFALEHFLGDRLAAGRNLKRYTRTALAWMADTGLRRRSRLTRHVRDLADDPSEPDWGETFARWRRHVDRALDPVPSAPGAGPEELVLYAVIRPGFCVCSLGWVSQAASA